MISKKDNLFNKLDRMVKRNYNNELENILEQKDYDENVKNLLLGILYKLEAAYPDYRTIKREVSTKDEYIENFLDIVRNICNNIKLVKPNSEESEKIGNRTFLIDREKKEIICYPIERKLLYSLIKLSNKESLIKDKYYLLDTTMTNLLNVGYNINTVEPLRDFNGWSWSTLVKEIESIEYNLIYQNLLMIVGYKFLNSWININEYIIDYIEYLNTELEKKYDNKNIISEILEIIYKLSILLELKYNPNIKEKMNPIYLDLMQKKNSYEDKKKFIIELTARKKELIAQIRHIDTVLNNKDLLIAEYEERNSKLPLEKKIFSAKVLNTIMAKEREECYLELEKCNEDINPQKFIKNKVEVENKLTRLEILQTENLEKDIQESLIELQIYFMSFLNERIKKASTRNEIIDLIFEIRYYEQLPINQDDSIKNVKKLDKYLEKLKSNLIEKACLEKILYRLYVEDKMNYSILKSIFDIRIIDLEKIFFKIIKEKDEIYLQLFDEDIFEEKIIIENIDEESKKELIFKLNKKIKLFL